MFGNLKQRIGQSSSKTPVRRASAESRFRSENSPAPRFATSTPTGRLVDIGGDNEQASGPAVLEVTDAGVSPPNRSLRSRNSSVSSQASGDAEMFAPVAAAMSQAVRQYAVPSDAESSTFGDTDDQVLPPGTPLNHISKEELYKHFCRAQKHAEKYRQKFSQVLNAYRDVDHERDKLKKTLAESQDKAFQRIEELKEQLRLESQAKYDLDNNYQAVLEEKDEALKTLKTQISLLRRAEDFATATYQLAPDGSAGGTNEESMERLSKLFDSSKDTIRRHQEQITYLEEEQKRLLQLIQQREAELNMAAERLQGCENLLLSSHSVCSRHQQRLVYGENAETLPADDQQGQAGGGDTVPSEHCLVCRLDRVENLESQLLHVTADNETLKANLQASTDLAHRLVRRVGSRDGGGGMMMAHSSISSLEDSLRTLESSLLPLVADYEQTLDTKRQLEHRAGQLESNVNALEQRLRESVAGTCTIDGVLREERGRSTQLSTELRDATSAVQILEESLQQKASECNDVAGNFVRLKSEAKAKIKELKIQLAETQKNCSEYAEREAAWRTDVSQLDERLKQEKVAHEQFRESVNKQIGEARQWVQNQVDELIARSHAKKEEQETRHQEKMEELTLQKQIELRQVIDELKAEHDGVLTQLNTKHNRAVSELQDEHTRVVSKLEEEHKNLLREFQEGHEQIVVELQSIAETLKRENDDLHSKLERTKTENEKFASEIAEMAEAMGKEREAFDSEIMRREKSESEMVERAEWSAKQLESAQAEVNELQAQLREARASETQKRKKYRLRLCVVTRPL